MFIYNNHICICYIINIDDVLNRLAVVLKMLHLDDFRDLQTDLNALIALGQEYTANPRTNTKLGKVGR